MLTSTVFTIEVEVELFNTNLRSLWVKRSLYVFIFSACHAENGSSRKDFYNFRRLVFLENREDIDHTLKFNIL